MVAALGGPADLVEHPGKYLTSAPVTKACTPVTAGKIAAIDTRAIGVALIELGGGRLRAQDKIDHRVGYSEFRGVGKEVGPDQPICLIHAVDGASWERAAADVRQAVQIVTGERILIPGAIHERIAVD
jgi:thymidine phosphorylase